MNSLPTIRTGGVALILTGILYPVVFLFLAIRFHYPEILDGPAGEALPRLLAGGGSFRAAWVIYGLLPLLLLPAGTGALAALRRQMPGGMRIAHTMSAVAAFALMLGLLRWPSIHWELAKAYAIADGSQRRILEALFAGFNSYLGNFIGEFLGEGLMHGFLLIMAVAMLRNPGFPKWMAWTGIVISSISLIGVFRNASPLASAVQDFENTWMLFPIWLVLAGVGLIRLPDSTR